MVAHKVVACAEVMLAAAVVVVHVPGGVAGPRERNALGWFSKHMLPTESPTARLHGQSRIRLPGPPSAWAVVARHTSMKKHRRDFDDLTCSSGYEIASSDCSMARRSNGGRPRRRRPAASLRHPRLLGTGEGEFAKARCGVSSVVVYARLGVYRPTAPLLRIRWLRP